MPERRTLYTEISTYWRDRAEVRITPVLHPILRAHLLVPQRGSLPLRVDLGGSWVDLADGAGAVLDVWTPREEIQTRVEAETERRWNDWRTRCPSCKATGRCWKCKGLGYELWACPHCDGDGQMEKRCDLCEGSGRLRSGESCYGCFGGHDLYICPFCDDPVHGRGRIRRDCPVCQRSGKRPQCGGTGRISPP